jgi:hypothetical protein
MVMSSPSDILRVGNAQAFWGDAGDAPAKLAAQVPDLDYLTLDYLAEVSMSILAKQRSRDPAAGYAADFVGVVRSLAPLWREGRRLRVVANAGGLNPAGCARACAAALAEAGCRGLRIGVVDGDDVLPGVREALSRDINTDSFRHLETGQSIGTVSESIVTANAYLGAAPIADVLALGADVVITGRVADPSLTVGPCAFHFGWRPGEWDRLAGATIAGHLIECGTQVTGGISTDWLELDHSRDIGFPVVEVAADGGCVVTKPAGTGGAVNERTVKEQLLYEIGDPGAYLSPDVTLSMLGLRVAPGGPDRVGVTGAAGGPPPATYKVSATYRAGYRASGTLTIFGRGAVAKARRCGEIVLRRLDAAGFRPERTRVECLGAGDVVPVFAADPPVPATAMETVLRVSVADTRREVVERFTRELMPLITSGPQGVTGYAEGRPGVREVFGYWPTKYSRSERVPKIGDAIAAVSRPARRAEVEMASPTTPVRDQAQQTMTVFGPGER